MVKLILFDIDGTLCDPMQSIQPSTILALQHLKESGYYEIGVVGGSDRAKAVQQLGLEVLDNLLDHCFHENGCVYLRHGELVAQDSLEDFIPATGLARLTRFLIGAVLEAESPIMTGTFIERRTSMINCSPCGRACTREQRERFFKWDQESGCRQAIVDKLKQAFPDLPLEIAVGGMISIDIFPKGLNKTRCLTHLEEGRYEEIHFVGDRVEPGGNDYEIYSDKRVVGHRTSGYKETENIITNLLGSNFF